MCILNLPYIYILHIMEKDKNTIYFNISTDNIQEFIVRFSNSKLIHSFRCPMREGSQIISLWGYDHKQCTTLFMVMIRWLWGIYMYNICYKTNFTFFFNANVRLFLNNKNPILHPYY